MILRMRITRETEDSSDDHWVEVHVEEGIPADWAKDDDGNEYHLSEDEREQARELWEKAEY